MTISAARISATASIVPFSFPVMATTSRGPPRIRHPIPTSAAPNPAAIAIASSSNPAQKTASPPLRLSPRGKLADQPASPAADSRSQPIP